MRIPLRQIIAMGGGGFSMENSLALDLYILKQASTSTPSVCFLPTASGDSQEYIVRFYEAYSRLPCKPSHLSLLKMPTADLKSFLGEKEIILVGGGNTRNLLALWREWELDQILRQLWENGTILAGLSAGAICWFEQGVTDSIPGQLNSLTCLGYLPGSFCPHYDGEVERRPAYHRLISRNQIQKGFGVEDGVALHFVHEELKAVVRSRFQAKAYRVEKTETLVEEVPLESTFLEKYIPQ